jgi:hypothetical protein
MHLEPSPDTWYRPMRRLLFRRFFDFYDMLNLSPFFALFTTLQTSRGIHHKQRLHQQRQIAADNVNYTDCD